MGKLIVEVTHSSSHQDFELIMEADETVRNVIIEKVLEVAHQSAKAILAESENKE